MNTGNKLTCSKCRKDKSTNEFYTSTTHKRGFDYYCKACRRTTSRDYYRRKRQSKRLGRPQHTHPATPSAQSSERKTERWSSWLRAHPLATKTNTFNYKAKKANVAGHIGVREVEMLWDIQQELGGRCPFTNLQMTYKNSSPHHLIHLDAGGLHDLSNVIFVVHPVSRHKRLYSVLEFCRGHGLPYDWVSDAIFRIQAKLQERLDSTQ